MQMQFESFGDGYPLFILHDPIGSSENWRTLSHCFAGRYRIFALDLRNYGGSPHDPVMD